MKKFLFLFLFPVMLQAQTVGGPVADAKGNFRGYFLRDMTQLSGQLQDISVADTTSDTTEAIDMTAYKTLFLNMSAADSVDMQAYYQVSLDKSTWSTAVLIDSCVSSTNATIFASKDVTSTVLGYPFVRFIFVQSEDVTVTGAVDPKYSAGFLKKKY